MIDRIGKEQAAALDRRQPGFQSQHLVGREQLQGNAVAAAQRDVCRGCLESLAGLVKIEAAFRREQVRCTDLRRELPPCRRGVGQEFRNAAGVVTVAVRQRFIGEARQPRKQGGQGGGADRQGAVRVEQQRQQVAQDRGRAHRQDRIVRDSAGIAVGGTAARLVRLDHHDLAAVGAKPKRNCQTDDAAADHGDVGRNPAHLIHTRLGGGRRHHMAPPVVGPTGAGVQPDAAYLAT